MRVKELKDKMEEGNFRKRRKIRRKRRRTKIRRNTRNEDG
jgi:hypothetical protein